VIGDEHPLAGRDWLRPGELSEGTLVLPAAAGRLDYLERFADRFGIAGRSEGPNLGMAEFLERIRAGRDRFSLLPADLPLPAGAGLAAIPIVDPTPLYAWSLIWRRDDHHPRLAELLESFAAAGRAARWLEFRPDADWLPDPDLAGVTRRGGSGSERARPDLGQRSGSAPRPIARR
jgi:DNA-binding transcriptional LysR family regulator